MRASFRLSVVLLLALCCLSSCGKKDKVIPRSTMADIYADLFISDQWLREQHVEFMKADTCRFYEPIFNKYGYTTLDFRNSANHYLQDPRRFSRILQRASARLDERAKYLDRLSLDIESIQGEIARLQEAAVMPPVFYDSTFFAASAWSRPDLEMNGRGAYMPELHTPISVPFVRTVSDTLSVSNTTSVPVIPERAVMQLE